MDVLTKYLDKRYTASFKKESPGIKYAPFITISREYGCPAYIIAKKLVERINEFKAKKSLVSHWSWINKEIVERSAVELNISKERVDQITHAKEDSVFDDFFNTFSKQDHPNDLAIRNSVREIIHSYAFKGNVVIVGRAGVSILSNFKNGIHICLKAPMEWRMNRIISKTRYQKRKVLKMIAEKDRKRAIFRKSFKKNPDETIYFDLIFNCETLSIDEINMMIMHLMKEREMI